MGIRQIPGSSRTRIEPVKVIDANVSKGVAALEADKDVWEGLAHEFSRLSHTIRTAIRGQRGSVVVLVPSDEVYTLQARGREYA